jgi:hypothetical protein
MNGSDLVATVQPSPYKLDQTVLWIRPCSNGANQYIVQSITDLVKLQSDVGR